MKKLKYISIDLRRRLFEMNNIWFSSLLINENRVFWLKRQLVVYCFEFISYLNKDK